MFDKTVDHIGRYLRAAALVALGFFLLDNFNNFWGANRGSLHTLNVLFPVWSIAVFAVVAGLLLLTDYTHIVGYLMAITVSGALTISSIIALFTTSPPHSPVVVFMPVAVLAYFEGLRQVVKHKYDTQHG